MHTGEVLRQPREAVVSFVRGLMSAVEAKLYGSPEQRKAAYDTLRVRFEQLFADNSQKVGSLKSDPNTKRLLFNWTRIGRGSLDEKDGNYVFHVSSHPYDRSDSIWGDKVKVRHNILYLSQEEATTLEYIETRVTPPTDKPFPMVTESRVKRGILDVQTASDLVEGLGMPAFKPTIDSWLADYPDNSGS